MNAGDPRIGENMEELCRVLAATGDRELLESFLRCLLTPAERADIASRWALVKALREGLPQREIARNLGLSLCKITRGSRELKKPGSAFKRILAVLDHLDPKGGTKDRPPGPLDPHHGDGQ
ncbi:MAG: trp operon repressor [Treponema sp.]|jgi:TrpR family trp operon transcriptional repressor|nr:trp operon repressor [Treponema sp.]